MSEELSQIQPVKIGRYLLYKLGATTLRQLKNSRVLSSSVPSELERKKPDLIVIFPGGKVKAIVEYKTPSELNSNAKIQKAKNQEIEVARALCKLLIVSDGKKSYWFNALNGEEIVNENGTPVRHVFDAKHIQSNEFTKEESLELERLIDKIDHSVSETENIIQTPEVLDPSQLAKTIWQKIWVHTGKEPEKCLYNVVELFVFKFLSDLGVLSDYHNFTFIASVLSSKSSEEALRFYANNSRKEIRSLFPAGPDGTTIINGTIFVNEKGEPNIAQAHLFGQIIQDLGDYDEQFGSFRYIKKEFKTRLFESFLRQGAGIKALGQYFTPRSVVQAMVRMSDASKLREGSRICDPFCGVGGFILETIIENENLYREFIPKNGQISSKVALFGFDKGTDEKDDERTIILAKANMLIYFSDLIVQHHEKNELKEFSEKAINSTFYLQRTALGTFERVADEPYDLILTNPPYVTSGSASLKRSIQIKGLERHYVSGARGTEGLAMEWIINNLKPGGQALVVVPDGLLNQGNMITFILQNTILEGIISLPIRTFFSTPKKTYILCLRKKSNSNKQLTPVFGYLVREIGETRDNKRFKIQENDLDEMVGAFKQFCAAPSFFKPISPNCKVIDFENIEDSPHLMIERWWSYSERAELGVEDEEAMLSEDEFIERFHNLSLRIRSFDDIEKSRIDPIYKEVSLGEKGLFRLTIGKRVLKKDILKKGIPVYSANVNHPFGYVESSNLKSFEIPSLIWGIDGNFDWNLIEKGTVFATTDHCGRLQIISNDILPDYLLFALKITKSQLGFDRTYRASLRNIAKDVTVKIPWKDGRFDVNAQRFIIEKQKKYLSLKKQLIDLVDPIAESQILIDEFDALSD